MFSRVFSSCFSVVVALFKPALRLLPIDFSRSWLAPIMQQRGNFLLALAGEVASGVFSPLRVVLLGWIFAVRRFDYLVYLFVVWVVVYIIGYVSRLYGAVVRVNASYSLQYHAHTYFLQVDPMYHAHRSSGTILGKIERAAKAYEEFVQTFFFDMVELPIGILTVVCSLAYYSLWLSAVVVCLLAVIVFLSTAVMNRIAVPKEHSFIRADDILKGLFVENLVQVGLIRTSFASNEVNNRMKSQVLLTGMKDAILEFLFNSTFNIIKMLYLLSFFVVACTVFWWIYLGKMNPAVGIALVMSYMRGTYDIIKVEKPVRIIVRSVTRIKDLFAFINQYGKQSYPVLQCTGSHAVPSQQGSKEIVVTMKQIDFDYTPSAKILTGHSLQLAVSRQQENKLYGIIGPSGIGKSTLLLLLGGQLKPSAGEALVDGIDIYKVDDHVRQRLIALQGQTASNLRGTLRYNLLFGLPETQVYSSEQLQKMLEDVGLWQLFAHKNELDTLIGEGGMTLSGGQRQRLNFANLYLRARYFKPSLILIDEPTSSLDQISERAITEMIGELAHDSVTFVIAHRLQTIEKAVGILDCSLLASSKELEFYPHAQLRERSQFYERLMQGTESIDD